MINAGECLYGPHDCEGTVEPRTGFFDGDPASALCVRHWHLRHRNDGYRDGYRAARRFYGVETPATLGRIAHQLRAIATGHHGRVPAVFADLLIGLAEEAESELATCQPMQRHSATTSSPHDARLVRHGDHRSHPGL